MVLWQAGMSSDPRLPASHEVPGVGTRWVLEVDDVRKMFADLKPKGVRFKDEQPCEEGWGFAADLLDLTATLSQFTRRASLPGSLTGPKRAGRHREPLQSASSLSGLDTTTSCA
ncbi:hypothetical protein E6H33_06295 [Candidatus Bathyarchaeota archaeon]|nr:MAG: hypothetical protein E6H33_06295 [Candidatus Bathyarchaeota archaeon]